MQKNAVLFLGGAKFSQFLINSMTGVSETFLDLRKPVSMQDVFEDLEVEQQAEKP